MLELWYRDGTLISRYLIRHVVCAHQSIDDTELATFEDSLYIQAVLEAIRTSADSTTASAASWVNVSVMQEEDEVVPLTALRHHNRPSHYSAFRLEYQEFRMLCFPDKSRF